MEDKYEILMKEIYTISEALISIVNLECCTYGFNDAVQMARDYMKAYEEDHLMSNEKKKLKDIREWLIENIFRDAHVMFSNAREVGQIDLIEVIASLYNEYHNAVMGEPYDYMFHWANKCGSWVEEDLFDRVLKEEDPDGKTL